MTIKVLGNTVGMGASNSNYSSSKLLRIVNTAAAVGTVTLYDTVANVQIGTITLVPNEILTLTKKKTDALTASANTILATPIASTG